MGCRVETPLEVVEIFPRVKATAVVLFTGFISPIGKLRIRASSSRWLEEASWNYPHPPREGPRRAKFALFSFSWTKKNTWIEPAASSASASQRIVVASFKRASALRNFCAGSDFIRIVLRSLRWVLKLVAQNNF